VNPGLAPNDGDRLAVEHRASRRPRRPVQRVLQHSGDAVLILGRRDEEGVRLADGVLEARHRGRIALLFDIEVVERDAGQVEHVDAHVRRRQLDRGADQATVVRTRTQTPGEGQDANAVVQ
jgi:hypothetical protein